MKISKTHSLVVHAVAFGSTAALAGMLAFGRATDGGTLSFESHSVESIRGDGMDSDLEGVANGLRDGSFYGWITDRHGNMIVRTTEVAEGDVESIQVVLPGWKASWSFQRNRKDGPWHVNTWVGGEKDQAQHHGNVVTDFVIYTDERADGMPEKKKERAGVGEPVRKYVLSDAPWVSSDD